MEQEAAELQIRIEEEAEAMEDEVDGVKISRKPRLLIPVSSHKKPYHVLYRKASRRMPLRRRRLYASMLPLPHEFEAFAGESPRQQEDEYEPFPDDWPME